MNFKYAGFWRRLWASILDSIIFASISLFFVLIISILFKGGDDLNVIFWIEKISPYLKVLFFLYEVFFISSFYQSTPGKMLLGIKVVDENGNPLSFNSSFLRASFKDLYFILAIVFHPFFGKLDNSIEMVFIFFAIPDGLTMFFNEKRQTIHDILVKSCVIYR